MGWAPWESLSSLWWAGQQARAGGEACCLHEQGWKERLTFRTSKASVSPSVPWLGQGWVRADISSTSNILEFWNSRRQDSRPQGLARKTERKLLGQLGRTVELIEPTVP